MDALYGFASKDLPRTSRLLEIPQRFIELFRPRAAVGVGGLELVARRRDRAIAEHCLGIDCEHETAQLFRSGASESARGVAGCFGREALERGRGLFDLTGLLLALFRRCIETTGDDQPGEGAGGVDDGGRLRFPCRGLSSAGVATFQHHNRECHDTAEEHDARNDPTPRR